MVKPLAGKCAGCRVCQLVCSAHHFNVYNPYKAALAIEETPETLIYETQTCIECGACMAVCPTEAIFENDGKYLVDKTKCVLCGACVNACPERVIFVHEDVEHVIKCDECGKCVDYCPHGALTR